MHKITELPAWERLFKRIVWKQIGEIEGIRTFWDLQQNQQKHGDEDWQEKMMQLELRVSQMQEYRDIAFFHHLLLKKI